MNATPLLATLLQAMMDERLDAVLIGNAAAAMHGAPVTTLDFDFMFRDTPVNLRKLKRVADAIEATIMRPAASKAKGQRAAAMPRSTHVRPSSDEERIVQPKRSGSDVRKRRPDRGSIRM